MNIDRAALPFVAGALAPAAALLLARRPRTALPFLALAAFMLYFFRDPDRAVPTVAGIVVAPADGRVMVAGPPEPGVAPVGDWQQVSIFLSPLDVHVNRMPVAGVVRRVAYKPGRFFAAYKPESALENEHNEIWIDTGRHTVVARQVVGVLARRIVCRIGEGAIVDAGQRFGLMKFGSRMDVFLPPAARLLVGVGETVRGGETLIARLPDIVPVP